jgi:hypothetical protein
VMGLMAVLGVAGHVVCEKSSVINSYFRTQDPGQGQGRREGGVPVTDRDTSLASRMSTCRTPDRILIENKNNAHTVNTKGQSANTIHTRH